MEADNPFWDHETDEPVLIIERAVWDEAEAKGWITPEHRELRLRNKLMHALGLDDGSMAYDEDGFATALIAEGIHAEGGVTLHVYTGDHNPPHAHVTLASDPKVNLRMSLETGEELKNSKRGSLKSNQVGRIGDLIVGEYADRLQELWEKNGPDRNQ